MSKQKSIPPARQITIQAQPVKGKGGSRSQAADRLMKENTYLGKGKKC